MLGDDLFYGTKKYHGKFTEFCEPLKQHLGITTAAYIRIGYDSKMELICSNCKWSERFIEKNYIMQDPGIVHPDNMDSGFAFVSTSDDQEYKDTMLHEAVHEFNFYHSFCYVEKNDTNFTLFYFATGKENNGMINKIVNSSTLVKQLIGNVNKQIITEFKDLPDNKIDVFKLKGDVFSQQKGIVLNEYNKNHIKPSTINRS